MVATLGTKSYNTKIGNHYNMGLEADTHDDDADENPFREEDLAAMRTMTQTLSAACNKSIIATGRGEVRDSALIHSILAGHGDVPIESCGPDRVMQENDHFDTAAERLIAVYQGTPEAQQLRAILDGARYILQPKG